MVLTFTSYTEARTQCHVSIRTVHWDSYLDVKKQHFLESEDIILVAWQCCRRCQMQGTLETSWLHWTHGSAALVFTAAHGSILNALVLPFCNCSYILNTIFNDPCNLPSFTSCLVRSERCYYHGADAITCLFCGYVLILPLSLPHTCGRNVKIPVPLTSTILKTVHHMPFVLQGGFEGSATEIAAFVPCCL